MSKNVSILEGGAAKTMPSVKRLITDTQSGLMAWVPEDERLIRTKHISENGTYVAAQEALYGYSKLTINVAGGSDGETIPTLEPDGEMQPTEEAEATEPDEFEEEYGVLEEDPDGTSETIAAPTGGKKSDAGVVGKDPETGDLVRVTVDPTTGRISKENLGEGPKAIAIVVMPSKMKYREGDTLSYTGIEVKLYSKYEETVGPDGSVQVDAVPYTDSRYPDGKIPLVELDFPMTYVGEEVEGYEQWISVDDDIIVGGMDIGGPVEYCEGTVSKDIVMSMGEGYVDNGNVSGIGEFCMTASGRGTTPTKARYTGFDNGDGTYTLIHSWLPPRGTGGVRYFGRIGNEQTYGSFTGGEGEVTFDDKTVFCGSSSGYRGDGNTFYCTKPDAESKVIADDNVWPYYYRVAWYMWYGYFVRNRIPVKWKSPYDGKELETSYSIQVARENDGGE